MQDIKTKMNGPSVGIPNGDSIKTINSGILPLHALLKTNVKISHVLDRLSNASLLSIGQLCYGDFINGFDKKYLRVYKQGKLVVKGLWN